MKKDFSQKFIIRNFWKISLKLASKCWQMFQNTVFDLHWQFVLFFYQVAYLISETLNTVILGDTIFDLHWQYILFFYQEVYLISETCNTAILDSDFLFPIWQFWLESFQRIYKFNDVGIPALHLKIKFVKLFKNVT